jgi:phosphoribosylglycinamide formyltransferase 1
MTTRIAILASGGGTNCQALLDAWRSGQFGSTDIRLVVSNKADAGVLERARSAGVTDLFLDPAQYPDRVAYDLELSGRLLAQGVNLVCLAGYLRILTPEFIRHFPLQVVNIHPALLPAFGGEGMYGHRVHEAVLAAGVKYSGCTVHFVDEGTDTGPIILQAVVPVLDHDTPDKLAERVLIEEHRLYPRAVALYCEHRLEVAGHRVRVLEKA